jgi:PAS domain S-box-containing protein
MNTAAVQLTGWSPAGAMGQPIDAVFTIRNEETGATVENPVTLALREGRVAGLANHTLLYSRGGQRRPIDDSGAPIIDSSGKVCGAVLIFRDVSEARTRDAELRERDRMIDLAHDAIIVADAGRRIKWWNTGAHEMYGWEESYARGQVMHELLNTRESVPIPMIDQVLRERGRWDGELIHTCRDGRVITVESRQVLLRGADGEATGILEINRDITQRKQAEAELRRAAAEAEEGRRTLEALMEHIPEGLTVADAPDVRIRMVSRHGLELAGRPPESLVGVTADVHASRWGIYHMDGKTPAEARELPLTRAVVLGEVTTDEEWLIRRPDGIDLPVLCNAAPIRDAQGNVTGGLIAWRDVSQRKELEEKLREAAKLESLGILAGGIAHDFNNLLTGIIGNVSLLLEEVPAGSTAWTFADGISRAAERAAKLTQQMLAYSGRGRFVVEPVDLSEQVREMQQLVETSLPANVELRLDLADTLPPVEVDLVQLQQVVMNLVVNGAEAIGTGRGWIEIATRVCEMNEGDIRKLLWEGDARPGRYVVLEVRDSGSGIEEANLGRIFDPFFTTKFPGRGLGLAAVQGIVRGHKGAIGVCTAPGAGATFRVFLPAISAAADMGAGAGQAQG